MDFKGLKPIGSDEFWGYYESNFRNNPKVAILIFDFDNFVFVEQIHDFLSNVIRQVFFKIPTIVENLKTAQNRQEKSIE